MLIDSVQGTISIQHDKVKQIKETVHGTGWVEKRMHKGSAAVNPWIAAVHTQMRQVHARFPQSHVRVVEN